MCPAAGRQRISERLLARLSEARAVSDQLFRLVRSDALYDRPIPERHRILFYVGHLEAFDANLIARDTLGRDPVDPSLNRLFSFGIDPVDGKTPQDKPADWPALPAVQAYAERARHDVDASLEEPNSQPAIYPLDQIIQVAVEHRLMHAETLAYMLHQLPAERKASGPLHADTNSIPPPPRRVEIPAGRVTLGLVASEETPFGWDNEFRAHTADVPAFAMDAGKVCNAQFLGFLRAGGYDHRSLWTDADWEWKNAAGISRPVFWTEKSGAWHYRTMFGEVPLAPAWPVYVSHAEASAYARWRGVALPTEAQFHRAAYGTLAGHERLYPWGDAPPDSSRGNFDFKHWTPTPVGAHPAGRSAFGVDELLGNGWEWTCTPFAPFSGFAPFPFYKGYSADFFDGKHYVMKGASPRTAACFLRRSFRNWFQAHYQYAYAGFRCVAS